MHVMMVLDHAAQQGYALPVRFAALTHDLGKATTPAKTSCRGISATKGAAWICSSRCASACACRTNAAISHCWWRASTATFIA